MSAGAAAARAAAERNEEEEMTRYTPKDIAENWEFKILRSATGAFRDPDVLRTALDAEQRAGWTLVEKFDDARVRLKRRRVRGQVTRAWTSTRTAPGSA